ncbi:MAG: hypothetical protein H7096_02730 [Flavobacterium sp.]|nr:hypothetical protein [Pedobacter sp.]
MRLFIIHIPFLPATAMALYPFILLKKKGLIQDIEIINHERIHLRQQVELLIIPFYLLYFINYLLNLSYYLNHDRAYFNIVFEREAYCYDKDLTYLQKRGLWAWVNFVVNKHHNH